MLFRSLDQDVYIGFIFRHAEPMMFQRQLNLPEDDEDFDDDSLVIQAPSNATNVASSELKKA